MIPTYRLLRITYQKQTGDEFEQVEYPGGIPLNFPPHPIKWCLFTPLFVSQITFEKTIRSKESYKLIEILYEINAGGIEKRNCKHEFKRGVIYPDFNMLVINAKYEMFPAVIKYDGKTVRTNVIQFTE
jgi:hypothetical protein